jgi:hypothetical protein
MRLYNNSVAMICYHNGPQRFSTHVSGLARVRAVRRRRAHACTHPPPPCYKLIRMFMPFSRTSMSELVCVHFMRQCARTADNPPPAAATGVESARGGNFRFFSQRLQGRDWWRVVLGHTRP